jgi:hypothetical protein
MIRCHSREGGNPRIGSVPFGPMDPRLRGDDSNSVRISERSTQ